MELRGNVGGAVRLCKAGVRASRKAHCHQPKSLLSVRPCMTSPFFSDGRSTRFFPKSVEVTGL